jgi:hypothetical protein
VVQLSFGVIKSPTQVGEQNRRLGWQAQRFSYGELLGLSAPA